VLAETLANSGQSNASAIVSNDILPKLEKLQSDEDVDVRFYASRSIQGIENLALKAK
jgi:serine/threonine-protein phosphatase 2A regulatory subunit A